MIPLRMDQIIVHAIAKLELAVFTLVKRRLKIFGSNVQIPPMVIWLYHVHLTKVFEQFEFFGIINRRDILFIKLFKD